MASTTRHSILPEAEGLAGGRMRIEVESHEADYEQFTQHAFASGAVAISGEDSLYELTLKEKTREDETSLTAMLTYDEAVEALEALADTLGVALPGATTD